MFDRCFSILGVTGDTDQSVRPKAVFLQLALRFASIEAHPSCRTLQMGVSPVAIDTRSRSRFREDFRFDLSVPALGQAQITVQRALDLAISAAIDGFTNAGGSLDPSYSLTLSP
jgi:hypothetical protein